MLIAKIVSIIVAFSVVGVYGMLIVSALAEGGKR